MQILPANEDTKLMKVGIFLELDTLDSYSVHFVIIECLVSSLYFQACILFVDLLYWHLLMKCLCE